MISCRFSHQSIEFVFDRRCSAFVSPWKNNVWFVVLNTHTHWYWTGFSENWRITPEIVYKLPGWFKGKSAGSPELIAGEGGQKPCFPASFPLSWSIDKQSTVEFFSTSGKSVHCSHQPRWWRASAPSELPEIYGKRTAVFFFTQTKYQIASMYPHPRIISPSTFFPCGRSHIKHWNVWASDEERRWNPVTILGKEIGVDCNVNHTWFEL